MSDPFFFPQVDRRIPEVLGGSGSDRSRSKLLKVEILLRVQKSGKLTS